MRDFIPHANIEIGNEGWGAMQVADAEGYFHFEMPSGHYGIHIYADGLSDEDIRMAMLTPCRDIEETLRALIARYGPRLCVLPEGPMVIPYLE